MHCLTRDDALGAPSQLDTGVARWELACAGSARPRCIVQSPSRLVAFSAAWVQDPPMGARSGRARALPSPDLRWHRPQAPAHAPRAQHAQSDSGFAFFGVSRAGHRARARARGRARGRISAGPTRAKPRKRLRACDRIVRVVARDATCVPSGEAASAAGPAPTASN